MDLSKLLRLTASILLLTFGFQQITILLGGLINAVLICNDIGGLLREFMRLVILSGGGIFAFSFFKVIKK